jgi:hypothetical protein
MLNSLKLKMLVNSKYKALVSHFNIIRTYARVTELRSPYSPSPKGDALAFGHPTATPAVGYRRGRRVHGGIRVCCRFCVSPNNYQALTTGSRGVYGHTNKVSLRGLT